MIYRENWLSDVYLFEVIETGKNEVEYWSTPLGALYYKQYLIDVINNICL